MLLNLSTIISMDERLLPDRQTLDEAFPIEEKEEWIVRFFANNKESQ